MSLEKNILKAKVIYELYESYVNCPEQHMNQDLKNEIDNKFLNFINSEKYTPKMYVILQYLKEHIDFIQNSIIQGCINDMKESFKNQESN